MCDAQIYLQEMHTVVLMLCRLAFHLSGKVVALHLDSSLASAYLYSQGDTMSLFHSRLACHILNLTDRHSITLIQTYFPTHLKVEANYLLHGKLVWE